MYALYGSTFTRTLIVQMVMAEGGIEYELHEIDLFENAHRSAEFLAINPAGHIPVLVKPDGEVIYETPAINLYLTEQHQLFDLAPAVGEPERGVFLSGLFFLSDDIEPIIKRYFYPHRYVLRHTDTQAMKQRSLDEVLARFAIVEKRLQENGPYFLGSRFSVIDIILSYWAEYINHDGTLDSLPAIRRCMELVENRPKLRGYFDELIECRVAYSRLQAEGGGVK